MHIKNLSYIRLEDYAIVALRLSLALIFFWFGVLKIFGYNPVFEIVYGTFPFLATETGNLILGIGEALIGLLLFINRFPTIVHTVLVLHLAGTFLTLVTSPALMYEPHFPVLTLEGEFVVKNAILAVAGIVVLINERRRRRGS